MNTVEVVEFNEALARIAELEEALRLALKQWEVYADSEREIDKFKYYRIAEGTDAEAGLFRGARKVLDHE